MQYIFYSILFILLLLATLSLFKFSISDNKEIDDVLNKQKIYNEE